MLMTKEEMIVEIETLRRNYANAVASNADCEREYAILKKEYDKKDVVVAIDNHYNFNYECKNLDEIRLDPYFINKEWKLNSKDDTGCLFHILKTVARFGDKNDPDREIKAIYKSILRMAELYDVELN